MKPVLIAGSMALDDVKTPFGERKACLGGSGVHSAVAASFFSPVRLVSVIGKDFPAEHIDFLSSKKVDLKGVRYREGKTFRWSGYYEFDMNQAHTLKTDLNVLSQFDPELPEEYLDSRIVFLANLDPELQLRIIGQMKGTDLVIADSMNYWIQTKKEKLMQVIRSVDVMLLNEMEARELMGTPNLISAASGILAEGAKHVIIKKGEHGALFFTKKTRFSAPSFPQEMLIDPTGAGDSFAGGFAGYLAKTGDRSVENMKKAVVIGTVMASYNVEGFSLDRMRDLTHQEITSRYRSIKDYCEFMPLKEGDI